MYLGLKAHTEYNLVWAQPSTRCNVNSNIHLTAIENKFREIGCKGDLALTIKAQGMPLTWSITLKQKINKCDGSHCFTQTNKFSEFVAILQHINMSKYQICITKVTSTVNLKWDASDIPWNNRDNRTESIFFCICILFISPPESYSLQTLPDHVLFKPAAVQQHHNTHYEPCSLTSKQINI